MQRLYKREGRPNWYVNLGGGVYRSTGCRDKQAAELRAREFERRLADPRSAAPPPPTLAVALDRALTDREQRGRAAGTIHMWKIKTGQLARVLGRDTPIDQIDAEAVDRYTAARLPDASRSTIGKELGVLRVTLELAKRRRPTDYPHDIDSVMPVSWGTDYEPRERALSSEEMRRVLLDLLDDNLPMTRRRAGPPRKIGSKRSATGPAPKESTYDKTRTRSMKERAARVAWIVATSGRWSESERARREDIDWTAGVVHVRGTKTEGAKRDVPILPTTEPLLRIALEHGNEGDERGRGLLFTPWGNVRRDLHAVCRRLGIEPVSPNDLRRTTAQWLRNAGIENGLIYPVMGHKDARMVERVYGRIQTEALGEELRKRLGKVKAMPALALAEVKKQARRKRRSG